MGLDKGEKRGAKRDKERERERRREKGKKKEWVKNISTYCFFSLFCVLSFVCRKAS